MRLKGKVYFQNQVVQLFLYRDEFVLRGIPEIGERQGRTSLTLRAILKGEYNLEGN